MSVHDSPAAITAVREILSQEYGFSCTPEQAGYMLRQAAYALEYDAPVERCRESAPVQSKGQHEHLLGCYREMMRAIGVDERDVLALDQTSPFYRNQVCRLIGRGDV